MDSEQPPLPPQPGGQGPASFFQPAQSAAKATPPAEKPGPPVPHALAAILLTGLIMALLMTLSTNAFESYGWVLFVGSPALAGAISTLLYNRRAERREQGYSPRPALWVVWLAAMVCSLGLLIFMRVEGLICVAMALPIALPLALIGGLIGQVLSSVLYQRQQRLQAVAALVLLYPAAQQVEVQATPEAPPHEVVTRLRVQASPERIWQEINRPVQYPAEVGLLFRAGVAYPTRTAIATNPGGQRVLTCAYSQGQARLPITVWRPGRELRFAVPETPAPMRELTPYPKLHAPHLHGYFRVESGTFRLWPQPDGSTVLEGRTVYRHAIGPRGYWQLWSDYLLDDMHTRVLTALKTRAEHD